MTTIPIEVSSEQLLRAVERLPSADLEAFVADVIALRAQRVASHLTSDETTLLQTINTTLTPDRQQRYEELVARRQAETIRAEELQELVQLTDAIEARDAERLVAIRELAQLRGTTVLALIQQLGLAPAHHA